MPEHIRPNLVSFDNIDYNNEIDLKNAQESMLREQWIRSQELNITRNALKKCHKVSGVNHYENCRDLAEKYLNMLQTHRVKGYMGYQKNDPSK